MEIPYTVEDAARHRAVQRQARHLAVPGLRSDAVRRAVLDLHPPAHRRRSSGRTASSTCRSARSTPCVLIASSVTMVMAWASLKMNDFGKHRLYLGADDRCWRRLPGRSSTSSTRDHLAHGEGPSHSTFFAIYFTLTGLHGLHILGGIVVMVYFLGPGAKLWKTNAGAVHQPHRGRRALLALRRPGLDLPVPGVVPAVAAERSTMHSGRRARGRGRAFAPT